MMTTLVSRRQRRRSWEPRKNPLICGIVDWWAKLEKKNTFGTMRLIPRFVRVFKFCKTTKSLQLFFFYTVAPVRIICCLIFFKSPVVPIFIHTHLILYFQLSIVLQQLYKVKNPQPYSPITCFKQLNKFIFLSLFSLVYQTIRCF